MHTCQETPVCQITGGREAEMGLEAAPAVDSQASLHCSGLRETARIRTKAGIRRKRVTDGSWCSHCVGRVAVQ